MSTQLLVLTISTCILVSGVMNQAPTPPSASKQMETALNKLVTEKCWKVVDVAGITFTASRRAQAPTPPPTNNCPANWSDVKTKWTANNQLLVEAKTKFDAAMVDVTACLKKSSKRRLQAPSVDHCKDGETKLGQALDLLEQTLGSSNLSTTFVNGANSVTMISGHTAVNVTGDNGATSASNQHKLLVKLRSNCISKKLITWPASRRAQAPTPPAPKPDATCTTNLSDLIKIRKARVTQVNTMLALVTPSRCTSTSRRLKRIMKDKRVLQAPTPPAMCDTSEKAVRLALANLTLYGASKLMSLVAVAFAAVAAMFF